MSRTDAGPNAARYLSTSPSGSAPGAAWPLSHASVVVKAAGPVRPQIPRGGTWTVGTRCVTA